MKRVVTILIVLIVSGTVAYAQFQIPDWTEVIAGVWAHSNPAALSTSGNDGFFGYYLSMYADNSRRLHTALSQLRAANPDLFDQTFAAQGLELRESHVPLDPPGGR